MLQKNTIYIWDAYIDNIVISKLNETKLITLAFILPKMGGHVKDELTIKR